MQVAETLAEAAAIDTLRAAIPGQLEAFSAVSTEKFQPPIEVHLVRVSALSCG